MTTPLEFEFRYYVAHQSELVHRYNGKVVVIKDQQVIGAYDNEMAAITETYKHHALGTFLVQRVTGNH